MTSRFVMPLADIGSGVKPPNGAKLFFFESDGVTDKNTHTTKAATISNTNPVIANSVGVFPDIYITGNYLVTLKDKNDVQIGLFGLLPINEFAAVTDNTFTKNFLTLIGGPASTSAVESTTLVIGDKLKRKRRRGFMLLSSTAHW